MFSLLVWETVSYRQKCVLSWLLLDYCCYLVKMSFYENRKNYVPQSFKGCSFLKTSNVFIVVFPNFVSCEVMTTSNVNWSKNKTMSLKNEQEVDQGTSLFKCVGCCEICIEISMRQINLKNRKMMAETMTLWFTTVLSVSNILTGKNRQ